MSEKPTTPDEVQHLQQADVALLPSGVLLRLTAWGPDTGTRTIAYSLTRQHAIGLAADLLAAAEQPPARS